MKRYRIFKIEDNGNLTFLCGANGYGPTEAIENATKSILTYEERRQMIAFPSDMFTVRENNICTQINGDLVEGRMF